METAQEGVHQDNHHADEQSDLIVHPEHLGKELAARHKGGSSIHGEKNDDKDGRRRAQNPAGIPEPVFKLYRRRRLATKLQLSSVPRHRPTAIQTWPVPIR